MSERELSGSQRARAGLDHNNAPLPGVQGNPHGVGLAVLRRNGYVSLGCAGPGGQTQPSTGSGQTISYFLFGPALRL